MMKAQMITIYQNLIRIVATVSGFPDHGNRTLYKTDYIKLGTEENTVSQVDSSLQPVSPSLVDVQPEKSYQVVTGSWTKVEFELCWVLWRF